MPVLTRSWPALALLTLSACTSPQPAATPGESEAAASPPAQAEAMATAYAGWYVEHGGQATFQPCGQESLTIGAAADLASRARRFGVTEDNPVYVRLKGRIADGRIDVVSVEQFGSAAPVHACAMTGTMTPGA